MSEPQHPQPHDNETNAGRSAPAVAPAVAQPALESLAAIGARLTQLRESKGWSIEDVSSRLKVSAAKLRALESGDVSHLPDTTFALGVVRSYAKMLGTDPAPFSQALRRVKGVPEPDLSMPASSGRDLPRGRVSLSLGNNAPKSRSWLWGVAAVIVAVIALAMWHTNGGDSSAWLARLKAGANDAAGSATGASGAVAQDQAAASATVADEEAAPASGAQVATDDSASQATPMPAPLATGVSPAAPGAPAVVAQALKPAASAPQQASAAEAAVPAEGQATVGIKVTQDSWFSVRQKDGKEVFSGLVRAGESKEIAGEPPFKVTVGNKAGLDSMSLDGQAVDPGKYASAKGNVARFALP